MKLNCLTILVCLMFTSLGMAQTTGFLGKRTLVSIGPKLRSPIWYNYNTNSQGMGSNKLKFQDGSYEEARNLLDYGLNASITYALTRKVGVTASFGYESFKFISTGALNNSIYWEETNAFYSVRKVTYFKGSYAFGSLGVTIASRDGLLPIGLTHEIGFGFGKVSPTYTDRNKYRLRQEFHADGDTNFVAGEFVNVDAESLFDDQLNYTVLIPYYKLKMIRPINANLLLTFGLQYAIHWMPEPDQVNSGSFIFNESFMYDQIRRKMVRNIANFEIGIGYCF